MITSADEYPIHQTPEPIAFPVGERNFYDRFFFNGYSEDGEIFFALAMGFYPQLGVVDGGFSIRRAGVQHNVRVSSERRVIDRMDLSVGPLHVEIEVPLRKLKMHVDHEIVQASIEFEARCPIAQEPRFTRRSGGRLAMDYTRMTQNGVWQGEIAVEGHNLAVDGFQGTRDRSWGIRPIGAPDPHHRGTTPQFFWLWTPINFPDESVLYHLNADAEGRPWNESGAVVPLLAAGADPTDAQGPDWGPARSVLALAEGTRRLGGLEIHLQRRTDDDLVVDVEPGPLFYMSGLGYTHPEWGHGIRRGPLDVGYDRIELDDVDDSDLLYRHVQAFCQARVRGTDRVGRGVVEQFFLGDYRPLALKGP